ncbi:MAG: indole-3-glycerol-phosphate synthase [Methanobacterium sp.]|uniref:indole-3-glycerol phosphate synthase TrpC n=1 Tax=Methanobacterium sp. TaxID=2164 RepID=UPI003C781E8B
MNIQENKVYLSDIIKNRRNDLQREMELKPIDILKNEIESSKKDSNMNNNSISFKKALDQGDDVAVICEYKPASPSQGDISNIKIEDAIKAFEKSGASAISILTEERYFKGSLENLKSAHNLTNIPLIRKDFIINEYQIYQAKNAGANAILLMNGIYPDLEDGISLCNELEIDPLIECRNRDDITRALNAGAEILGINNRNLENFEVDLKTTEKLAGYVPPEILLVSESGVRSKDDALQLSKYGVDALLIGTSIMGSDGYNGILKTATNIINAVNGERVVRT